MNAIPYKPVICCKKEEKTKVNVPERKLPARESSWAIDTYVFETTKRKIIAPVLLNMLIVTL